MKTLDEVITALETCVYRIKNGEDNCPVNCPFVSCCDPESGILKSNALDCLKEYRQTRKDLLDGMKRLEEKEMMFIHAMADSENNPPLTWDELKQMEGKPVWVEKKHSELYHMWGLVARIKRYQGHEYAVIKCPDLCNSPMSNIRLYDTMYLNDGWQAYRKEHHE